MHRESYGHFPSFRPHLIAINFWDDPLYGVRLGYRVLLAFYMREVTLARQLG